MHFFFYNDYDLSAYFKSSVQHDGDIQGNTDHKGRASGYSQLVSDKVLS